MRLLIDLLVGAILGFLGHQIRGTLRRDFDGGWFPVSCYVLGVLLAFPLVVGVYEDLEGMKGRRRLVAAYLLGFFSLGGGVVLGWYLDTGEGGA